MLSDQLIDEAINAAVEKWDYYRTTLNFQGDSRLTEQIRSFIPPLQVFIAEKFSITDDERKAFAMTCFVAGQAIVKSKSHAQEEVATAFDLLINPAVKPKSPFLTVRALKIAAGYTALLVVYVTALSFIFTPEAAGRVGGISAAGLILVAIKHIKKK